jgi:hypothetical protein
MKTLIFSLFISLAAILMVSCDKLDDLTKSPLDRFLSNVSHEWIVDSMRVVEYSSIPGNPPKITLERDTLYAVTKMVFTANEVGAEGVVIQTKMTNGIAQKKEIHWRYVDEISFDLVYYNPNTDTYNISVRYDITELSDHSFRLYRDENLVSDLYGSTYGILKTTIKMHR